MKKQKAENMYQDRQIVDKFAKSEKNDLAEHSVISNILDEIVAKEKAGILPKKIAILGAGANPQKYPLMMDKIKKGWQMDWVDLSPYMLEIAKEEVEKIDLNQKISFIENDFIGYLNRQKDNSIDYVVMQYCMNYIKDLKKFFELTSKKMKSGGIFTANLGGRAVKDSNFAYFHVNGEKIKGKVSLEKGDVYTVHFLNENGDVYATTEKNFFSDGEIFSLSSQMGLTAEIEKIKKFEVLVVEKR